MLINNKCETNHAHGFSCETESCDLSVFGWWKNLRKKVKEGAKDVLSGIGREAEIFAIIQFAESIRAINDDYHKKLRDAKQRYPRKDDDSYSHERDKYDRMAAGEMRRVIGIFLPRIKDDNLGNGIQGLLLNSSATFKSMRDNISNTISNIAPQYAKYFEFEKGMEGQEWREE
jgi:hypothetical protein